MPRKAKQIITEYTLTVKVMGKFYSATGASFDEAVDKIKIPNAKGMSIWRWEKEGKVREKIMQPLWTLRFFGAHGLSRDILLKNFRQMFN